MFKPTTFILCLAAGTIALAQAVAVDPQLPAYKKVAGISGNLNSVGSDTLNNLMTFWVEGFKKQYPGVKIQVEGHCDERGSNKYNMALGDKRANAARDYLVSLGIDASRITTLSYGEERPFVEGQTEDAWSQNRRAHFVVTAK